jgi:hypothetical protein
MTFEQIVLNTRLIVEQLLLNERSEEAVKIIDAFYTTLLNNVESQLILVTDEDINKMIQYFVDELAEPLDSIYKANYRSSETSIHNILS